MYLCPTCCAPIPKGAKECVFCDEPFYRTPEGQIYVVYDDETVYCGNDNDRPSFAISSNEDEIVNCDDEIDRPSFAEWSSKFK